MIFKKSVMVVVFSKLTPDFQRAFDNLKVI